MTFLGIDPDEGLFLKKLKLDPMWRALSTDKGAERTIPLAEPVAIHLLYWTAWADEGGSVHFRRNLYGRDKRLDKALRQEPSTS